MLHAACQYRQSKASLYKTGELPEREPEYIPWTGEKLLLLSLLIIYPKQKVLFMSFRTH